MGEEPLSEFDLIATYLRPLAEGEGSFGLLDDAAILTVPEGFDLVITKDMLLSGIHFFADDPPDLIAKKALRANLSDLTAKGAKPYRYSLGLAFPEAPSRPFMAAFCEGLRQDQDLYECRLIGGDTTRSQAGLVLSVTAYGLVPRTKMVRRQTAKPGDSLYVLGSLGDAALGLLARQDPNQFAKCEEGDIAALIEAYLLPSPPVKAASIIADFASAAMDISDGLFGDLKHLCKASDLSATLYEDLIPLSRPARHLIAHYPTLLPVCYGGGDDYQPLIAVSPHQEDLMAQIFEEQGLTVSRIGMMTAKREETITLLHQNGHGSGQLDGYTHF